MPIKWNWAQYSTAGTLFIDQGKEKGDISSPIISRWELVDPSFDLPLCFKITWYLPEKFYSWALRDMQWLNTLNQLWLDRINTPMQRKSGGVWKLASLHYHAKISAQGGGRQWNLYSVKVLCTLPKGDLVFIFYKSRVIELWRVDSDRFVLLTGFNGLVLKILATQGQVKGRGRGKNYF